MAGEEEKRGGRGEGKVDGGGGGGGALCGLKTINTPVNNCTITRPMRGKQARL